MGYIEHAFAFRSGGGDGFKLVICLPIAALECCDLRRASLASEVDWHAARRQPRAFVADQCERLWIGVFDKSNRRNLAAVSSNADGARKQFHGDKRRKQ